MQSYISFIIFWGEIIQPIEVFLSILFPRSQHIFFKSKSIVDLLMLCMISVIGSYLSLWTLLMMILQ